MKERWVPVPGWPTHEISNRGRVRVVASGIILKSRKMQSGYHYVTLLAAGGKRKDFRLHRLVALAWIGPPEEGMHACHNDGVKDHNWLKNIRYDTVAGNYNDKRRHGTDNAGERHGNSTLTDEDVVVIRRLASEGMFYRHIAELFGVNTSNVSHIVNRRTWSHI